MALRDCTFLPIPPGFPVGAIIGRQWQHVRDVRARTGASVSVTSDDASIKITGTPAAVAAAERHYRQQFKDHAESGETCREK